MGPGAEEDSVVEKARYDGNYKDGLKHGFGRMVYPNGDIYEGEWFENKVNSPAPLFLLPISLFFFLLFSLLSFIIIVSLSFSLLT